MAFITYEVKQQLDAYVNGENNDALPSERHKTMLNFLIGYAPVVVRDAMRWHQEQYPDEGLTTRAD